MKKIIYEGKSYVKKWFRLLGVTQGGAVFLCRNTRYHYPKATMWVLLEDGTSRLFLAPEESSEAKYVLGVYFPEDGPDELAFQDEAFHAWKKVYVFLYGEEGGVLMYTTKALMADVGIRYLTFGYSDRVEALREAVNVATMIDERLGNAVVRMLKGAELEPDCVESYPLTLLS